MAAVVALPWPGQLRSARVCCRGIGTNVVLAAKRGTARGGGLGSMKLGSGTAPSNSSLEIGFDEAGFRVVSGLKVGRAKSDLKIRHVWFDEN